jgi:hypothetical protein
MKTLFTALAVALWSLLCLGAWLLLDPTIAFLDANADWLASWPEVLYWTRWSLNLLARTGGILIGLLWGLGTLGIVGFAALVTLLWQRLQRRSAAVS